MTIQTITFTDKSEVLEIWSSLCIVLTDFGWSYMLDFE